VDIPQEKDIKSPENDEQVEVSVLETVKTRIKDPFVSSFVISLAALRWQFFYVLATGVGDSEKAILAANRYWNSRPLVDLFAYSRAVRDQGWPAAWMYHSPGDVVVAASIAFAYGFFWPPTKALLLYVRGMIEHRLSMPVVFRRRADMSYVRYVMEGRLRGWQRLKALSPAPAIARTYALRRQWTREAAFQRDDTLSAEVRLVALAHRLEPSQLPTLLVRCGEKGLWRCASNAPTAPPWLCFRMAEVSGLSGFVVPEDGLVPWELHWSDWPWVQVTEKGALEPSTEEPTGARIEPLRIDTPPRWGVFRTSSYSTESRGELSSAGDRAVSMELVADRKSCIPRGAV
jgi:hypothetical protein